MQGLLTLALVVLFAWAVPTMHGLVTDLRAERVTRAELDKEERAWRAQHDREETDRLKADRLIRQQMGYANGQIMLQQADILRQAELISKKVHGEP